MVANVAMAVFVMIFGFVSFRYRYFIPVFLLCLGLTWGIFNAQQRLEQRLGLESEGRSLRVVGLISSLPKRGNKSTTFLFDTLCIQEAPSGIIVGNAVSAACKVGPKRLRLSWYGFSRPQLRAGQYWQFDVKLKRPRGFSNPGGFDYEKWLFSQNIGATGYVINKGRHVELKDSTLINQGSVTAITASVNRIRESIALNIDSSSLSPVATAFLKALTIGDRRDITPGFRTALVATGTSHLLAVSGLHVGLVSGFIYLLIRILFRILPTLNQFVSAQKSAITFSLLIASIYCALAGFSLPTLRAWIMLACFAYGVLRETPQSSWDSYFISLFLVCLIQPFAVLELGFWLSYVAVAVILFVITGRVKAKHFIELNPLHKSAAVLRDTLFTIKEVWRSQWAIFIGLLPLLLIFYGQLPLLSPFVNIIAVPFIGWFVVPPALLGILASFWLSPESNFFFSIAGSAVDLFWLALENISSWSWLTLTLPSIDATLSRVCLVLLCGLLLLPKNVPLRWFGFFLILPVGIELLLDSGKTMPFRKTLAMASSIEEETLNFIVLDVGQGLSAVFETENHVLVYDTGPRLGETLDAGGAVVSPYLKSRGQGQIDMLVISHDDIDHAGGIKGLIEKHPVTTLVAWPDTVKRIDSAHLSSVNEQEDCRDFRHWQWDGVSFALFSWMTFGGHPVKDNNFSCILKVWGPGYSILLPGDIEKKAEYSLMHRMNHARQYQCLAFDLSADILVAPHHGSQSSSSSAFIHKVRPKQVVFPSAYRSRFGHPHSKIVQRYNDNNVISWNTASSGALRFSIPSYKMPTGESDRIHPEQIRVSSKRFWHLIDDNMDIHENIGKKRFQWLDL